MCGWPSAAPAMFLFLLFLTIGTKQIESLLVYDRQTLLFFRRNVMDLGAFDQGGQYTFPLLLAGIPPHLYRDSALPSRRKLSRRRGKRGGRLVKLKLWLTCSSSIYRTGRLGLLPVSAAIWLNCYLPTVLTLTPCGRRAVEEERRQFIKTTLNVSSAPSHPQFPALKCLYLRWVVPTRCCALSFTDPPKYTGLCE